MISVPLAKLSNKEFSLYGEVPSSFLTKVDSLKNLKPSHTDFDLKIFLVENNVIVHGKISTIIQEVCNKCLGKFDLLIENNNINLFIEDPKEDIIDLSNDLREELIVMFPIYPTCSDMCKGLCSGCGKNLNIDNCQCEEVFDTEEKNPWKALDNLSIKNNNLKEN